MRTTVDLPDDLFRRAKAQAAMRGMKLKELFAAMIEKGLTDDAAKPEKLGRKEPFPIALDAPGIEIPLLTADQALFGDLDELIVKHHDRSA